MREGGVRMHRRLPPYMHRERCGDTAALRSLSRRMDFIEPPDLAE